MTPEEMRHRAGRAVGARIAEMGTTIRAVAAQAGVHPDTLSGFIHGRHWPHEDTRERISKALGWPHGEIVSRAMVIDGLSTYSLRDLLCEALRRIGA